MEKDNSDNFEEDSVLYVVSGLYLIFVGFTGGVLNVIAFIKAVWVSIFILDLFIQFCKQNIKILLYSLN